jgi:hypothetical protein
MPPIPPAPVVVDVAVEEPPPAPVVVVVATVSVGVHAAAPRADRPRRRPNVRFMGVLESDGRRIDALSSRGHGRPRVVSDRSHEIGRHGRGRGRSRPHFTVAKNARKLFASTSRVSTS